MFGIDGWLEQWLHGSAALGAMLLGAPASYSA